MSDERGQFPVLGVADLRSVKDATADTRVSMRRLPIIDLDLL